MFVCSALAVEEVKDARSITGGTLSEELIEFSTEGNASQELMDEGTRVQITALLPARVLLYLVSVPGTGLGGQA